MVTQEQTTDRPTADGGAASDANPEDRSLSIDEASREFNVASRVLRTALGEGECKGHDFGGRIGWRTKRKHVREWLDKLMGDTGKPAPKRRRRAKAPKTSGAEHSAPKPGQVWRDRDGREGDRKVQVKTVHSDHVVIHNLAHKDTTTTGKVKSSSWHKRYELVK